jgi:predicted nucleotidyltransferase component of viral defense system
LDPDDLRRLAGRWRIPLGLVEKDHAITVALGVLASLPCAEELVFKGGTALRKVYFEAYRFSEDLDFTASSDVSPALLEAEGSFLDAGRRSGVEFRGIDAGSGSENSKRLRLRYADMNRHVNSIWIELRLRGGVALPAHRRSLVDPYGTLEGNPQIRTMALPEILAEKVRALLVRRKPRDLYDVHFLLQRGIACPPSLLDRKMALYERPFRLADLEASVRVVEGTWERDLDPLLGQVPPYAVVAEEVVASFR